MKRKTSLTHEFVEYIPKELRDGKIYVSINFRTVVHKCCCGCGKEVVTPLSPTDWELIFDGQSISLLPSIGNWSFECQSHYWIRHNRVEWVPQLSRKEIKVVRARDRRAKEKYFHNPETPHASDIKASTGRLGEDRPKESLWRWLKKWF